jgi:hypothetical protein
MRWDYLVHRVLGLLGVKHDEILRFFFCILYFVTFSSQVSLWNSGYSPWGEHGSDGVAPTQDIGGIGLFWWWRKPEGPEETTDTWPAPKIPFIRCNISSAASWDRTHTLHIHWLQACEWDTSNAPWTTRPPPPTPKIYQIRKSLQYSSDIRKTRGIFLQTYVMHTAWTYEELNFI